jgi:endo-1,4-beta-mannosidase
MKKSFLLIAFCLSLKFVMAQSESMLFDGVSDYIRRSQLTGELNRYNSLLINSFAQNLTHFDSLQKNKPLTLVKSKNNF